MARVTAGQISGRNPDASRLVDLKNGLLSRRIFIEREIYEQELEQVFARTWLFLAHESMIPSPGDFFTTTMGEDPVIVIRDSSGKVNAFINSCRHRGMKVCRADQGNAASFTCAYHGWTYGNDGKLIGVPNFQDAYFEQLDMEQWGLVPVAQVDSYKGLVFGNFDAGAPSLLDYLGPMAWYLDSLVDRREGGVEFIEGHKWLIPANWKFCADNFGGDSYHVGISHASAAISGYFDVGILDGTMVSPGNGHCVIATKPSDAAMSVEIPDGANPLLRPYAESVVVEAETRLGSRMRKITPIVGTVFPNFSYLRTVAHTFRVWHPRGPDKTEAWTWCFVDKAAPADVKQAIRKQFLWTFSPAGSFEQDDMENWQFCTITGRGVMTRQIPQSIGMGMGHDKYNEDYLGMASEAPNSENNQRHFYGFWDQLMSGRSWKEMTLSPTL